MSISRDPSIGGGGLDDPIAEPMAEVRIAAADEELDRSLRPRRLGDFIAQTQVTSQLEVFIEAAKRRDEPLDHVLLSGPPGLGKTSLAHIIAAELGAPIVQTAGPALERKADIASFLTALEPGSVFFIDEIHRLNRAIEETLYPAMEDRQLPIVLGQGAGARTVTLDLPAFTLVGATTRAGLLTTPLRDRFGVSQRLEHYEPGDLARIVRRSAGILEVEHRARWRARDRGTLARHAASRESPPEAGPRLRRGSRRRRGHRRGRGRSPRAARGRRRPVSTATTARSSARSRSSSPAARSGLSTLAAAVDEEQDTIEDVYEPYLLQQGLLKRTPRGRVITERGFEHLGLPVPDAARAIVLAAALKPLPARAASCPLSGPRLSLAFSPCPSSSARTAGTGS